MKKIIIFSTLFMVFGVTNVYADTCTTEKLQEYEQYVDLLEFEYLQMGESTTFKIQVITNPDGISIEYGKTMSGTGFFDYISYGSIKYVNVFVSDGGDCAGEVIDTLALQVPDELYSDESDNGDSIIEDDSDDNQDDTSNDNEDEISNDSDNTSNNLNSSNNSNSSSSSSSSDSSANTNANSSTDVEEEVEVEKEIVIEEEIEESYEPPVINQNTDEEIVEELTTENNYYFLLIIPLFFILFIIYKKFRKNKITKGVK